MGLTDIRRRLAALERSTEIVRPCIAFPALAGSEFLGYSVRPLFREEGQDPAEDFTVFGTDSKECARLVHEMSLARWLKWPLLTVRLDPITNPETLR